MIIFVNTVIKTPYINVAADNALEEELLKATQARDTFANEIEQKSYNILEASTPEKIRIEFLNERIALWASELDDLKTKVDTIDRDREYYRNIINIERDQEKPRKDIVNYSMIESLIWYMYDEEFNSREKEYEWKNITDLDEIKNILNVYFDKYYDENDDKDVWFDKVKGLCDELGYASNIKEYKKNPEAFKGNVADISTVIRVAITSKSNTPDLYHIVKLLGKDRIMERISNL